MAIKAEKQHAMFSMIESWQSSGESQQAFCKSHEISFNTFYYWYKRYRQAQTTTPSPSSFIPVQVQPVASGSPLVELILPDGRRLNIYQAVEASFLRTLLS
jgi:transposase-like protein